ncbi:branched-chain amino acid transport system II carrier protein [Salinivibrio sp. MA351]|uniref:Branched-chain amino acid transport system carrier protein n=1 Tax=Salinivibrio costicola subsp. alcaliphilus TaxID=272773 RepID=A0ABX3KT20_SALCS|nr:MULTISPECIES: branched-chain amino acid transport system II carrier protein [Salinivibrio]OOE90085.1 branched-chain amino acid transport system II carrier protein [Salinivibrio sp. AR647]OOE92230.1 branched-chain amino acid transport system II carrier protein [Salinivibrio sp. AR640]OOE96701.1 branched-chain amino acid transport system II carrier protein [Salinivibrio sp. MA351]OOF02879.1 branched-chain amino acid transport system II carrier protein [Salinivibrio sp. MA440]OOF04573.1 branch
MTKRLKLVDILALGFMTFAFFLGAGNIIFPPQAGMLAGDHYTAAMIGFLITAVGLPLIGIIAVAIAGGGWKGLTRDLPTGVATLMAVLIFIIIGPAFAAPRAGLVAYEIGFKPFLSSPGQLELGAFSVVFFAAAMFFSLSQGKLIDTIGKFLTPLLFAALAILAIAVIVNPQGEVAAAQGSYVENALTTGFLEGYNTMDTFAALMFGMLIVDVIRKKGIEDNKATCMYLIYAGIIAAAGLAFVYVSLFYLGSTASVVAQGTQNGGEIMAAYVDALFGPVGQMILAAIIGLACLTTVIGLVSACADYFSSLTSWTYRRWVVVVATVCAVVANVGLKQLIAISVPVLFALYPVAIALIGLTFIRRWLPNPALGYRLVMGVALVFSLLDAVKVMGVDMSTFNFLPLFDVGMAWLLPTLVAMVVAKFVGARDSALAEA